MKKIFWIILTLIFSLPSVAAGGDAAELKLLNAADSAYKAGNYTLAVEAYDSVARTYGTSAALYFNLANAWYEGGNIGMARLYLERARKLAPGNSEVENNLEYVSMKIQDANTADLKGKKGNIKPDEPNFWDGVTKTICADRSSNYWAGFAAMSFLLLLAAAALYLFSTNINARKVGFFGGLVFLFFSIVFIIFSFSAASYFESEDEGVITAYKVELLTEPSPDSTPSSSPLNRGTKLEVMSVETAIGGNPAWYRVRLNRSNIGWVRAEDFELI